MHPLVILGTIAAGAVAVAKGKKSEEPKPEVRGQLVAEASRFAQRRMARGASPEQAAEWAAAHAAEGYQNAVDDSGEIPPDFFGARKVSERYRF